MANFQSWTEDKLRVCCPSGGIYSHENRRKEIATTTGSIISLDGEYRPYDLSMSCKGMLNYIRFVGKDPKSKPHDELVLKAVKVYSADQQSVPRFEAHWSQTHGASSQPIPGGAYPGAAPANPYPSVAYPGPSPGAGQYPIPGQIPYGGGSHPVDRGPGPPQYPTLDFTAPPPVAAHASGTNPYPGFPTGAPGMLPGAAPAAPPNPYPAPTAPGPGGAFPAPGVNPYPSAAQPSAPVINQAPAAPAGNPYPAPSAPPASAPANPYPAPGGAAPQPPGNPYPAPSAAASPYPQPGLAAPAANPYPVPTGAPAPGPAGSNPYPSAAFAAPGGAAHSAAFPSPTQSRPHAPAPGGMGHPGGHGHPQQHPQHHPQHATGRKKALLVGCNYPGTRSELRGCCTDVQHIEYLLTTRFGFQDITVLRDDLNRQDVMPTKRNILAHIDMLVHGAQAGDSLFFHFSGHGSQKRDYSGDESDGMNETLVPTDHERAGQLVDDELNRRLVNPLPRGVRLHALLDACHSGTGLDLPYITKVEKASGRLYWVSEGPTRTYKGTNGGLAVQFGACKDDQLAQDTAALSGGTHTGAATYLFINSVEQLLRQDQPLTYGRIISEMLHQIKEFQKKQSGGRGLEEGSGGSTRAGGLGGMLAGMLINGAMQSMAGGGGGGGLGGLMSTFLGGGGSMQNQTPQLSATDAFDLNMPMQL